MAVTMARPEIVDVDTGDIVTKNIRIFSACTGVKGRDIAKILNRTEGNVSRQFNGKTAWSLKDIDKLCVFFGLEPYEFFSETPNLKKLNVKEILKRRPLRDSNPQPTD